MTRGAHQRLLAVTAAFALAGCATAPDQTPSPQPPKPDPAKPATSRAEIPTLGLDEFFQLHQSGKALVFDARPLFVYNFGHVPGAIHLPENRCADEIANRQNEIRGALASGKTLVVYCTGVTCPDAHSVAARLAAAGHPASVFTGGWDAWREAGMPVE